MKLGLQLYNFRSELKEDFSTLKRLPPSALTGSNLPAFTGKFRLPNWPG